MARAIAVDPSSNVQFRQLYLDDRYRQMKSLFIDIILRKLVFSQSPKTANILVRAVDQLVQRGLADDVIYKRLHRLVHTALFRSAEYLRQQEYKRIRQARYGNREDKRVAQLQHILKGYLNAHRRGIASYLDVGSGEGSITVAVGKLLKAKHTLGCDIVAPKGDFDFEFTLLKPDRGLPYASKSQDVVSAFMSLHHIKDVNSTLSEIYRVLKDDGIFIIREHDSTPKELSLFLDLMHGFYAMVWSKEPEMEDFTTHYSHYRTQDEVDNLIESHGFSSVYQGEPSGPWRYYYAVYCKSKFEDRVQRWFD